MEIDKILKLINEFSNSNLTSFKYVEGNLSLELANDRSNYILGEEGREPLEKTQPLSDKLLINSEKTDTSVEIDGEDNGKHIIKSPLVGTFYSSPSEEGAPYVELGDKCKKGQVLAIIEAMKVMNEIESTVDGIVEEILVKDQEVIEYGQPLFVIKNL